MSEAHRESVGSVGEEAAKLFAALAGAAGEPNGPYAAAAAAASDAVHGVQEHLTTGATECQWCPLCRVVHAVRQTSPEVRQHLAVAANALAQAAAGLLATVPPDQESAQGAPVQRIDLDDAGDERATDDGTGHA